jgi:hypothetical protein
MGRRIPSRTSGGQFRRATLANTFGLAAPVCEDCRRLNPVPVGQPKPATCHACGSERLR